MLHRRQFTASDYRQKPLRVARMVVIKGVGSVGTEEMLDQVKDV